jgi:hypothetical protein
MNNSKPISLKAHLMKLLLSMLLLAAGAVSALDYAGTIDGREAGVAMLDHPENLNAPSPWYAINDNAMRYFSPAVICYQPHTLKAGRSLTLRYRVIAHPGRGDATKLQSESKRYLGS